MELHLNTNKETNKETNQTQTNQTKPNQTNKHMTQLQKQTFAIEVIEPY
jgi:hypothetical protein